MSTGNTNNKSAKKNIRFPHELINDIELSVEKDKANNPNVNFSSWVLDACEQKLRSEFRKKTED
ncbi:DUF3950 domain-containing protein [Enterobacter soli]|uniref:YlcI/YnfO family protein n=1 Tax=Enterobacter cloacae complex TaxID=354276 RepID=UPI000F6600D9|nr:MULTISPECIES: YlcI/YnfO family protein [Enterobacter]MDU6225485.1 YlcI/YnfO family protein [Enterobacter asburiae]HCI9656536.1 DUF3950 domain-containing protein [Enterobacter hormaechei subsp. xiangfangensis]MBG0635036.1 DUF3950 domain-containing protein [Enterobacter ludwigii]MDM1704945.1 DUF3950 domain-containing protein [Enterobacter hormaechei]MDV5571647.1 YlcI/YnfO family protein [Enterobacter hormaechei]